MNELTKQSIRNFFNGVQLNHHPIALELSDRPDGGTVRASIAVPGAESILLEFPLDRHEHEFELSGTSIGTIRWCKKCGQSFMLSSNKGEDFCWQEVKDPS